MVSTSRPGQLIGLAAMGLRIERGRRDRLAEVADVDRLEAGLGRDHRQDREARHGGEAVGELVLGAEHHARPDDRRAGEGGADRLLAEALGPAIVGLAVGIGADRADVDEGLGARRLAPPRPAWPAPWTWTSSRLPLKMPTRLMTASAPSTARAIVSGRARSAAIGRDLADAAQRLQEPGASRVALGDAQPRARLQQRLAHIAADEAAAAEHGDEWRGAGVPHGWSVLGQRLNWRCPWANGHWRARGARQAVDRISRRPLSAAAYRQSKPLCPGGGIGRRTSFRCWRSQGRGGSSPLLGTSSCKQMRICRRATPPELACQDFPFRRAPAQLVAAMAHPWRELQRDRIDAIAFASRRRAIGKHMALVRATSRADDFGPDHAVAGVANVLRCPSAKGVVKLGQPVPLSNLLPAVNRGSPHRRQV